jgi:hypothetical protein
MKTARAIALCAVIVALTGCQSSTGILGALRSGDGASDASGSADAADAAALCSASTDFCLNDERWTCSADGASSSFDETCTFGCLAGACRPEHNCGAAAFLDGSNGRIGPAATIAAPFTFEMWVHLVSPVSLPYGRIAGVEATGACASGTDNWEIRVDSAGTISGSLGASFTEIGTGATVGFGTWTHIAISFDGNQSGRLYVDGVLAQQYSAAGTPTFGAGCAVRVATADNGSSLRARMFLGSVRYSDIERYTADFTRPVVMNRDVDTFYLFDMPETGGTFPVVDGSVSLVTNGALAVSSGPGC